MNLSQSFTKVNRLVPVAYSCPGVESAGMIPPTPPRPASSSRKELQWGKPPLQVLPEALGEAAPFGAPATSWGTLIRCLRALGPFLDEELPLSRLLPPPGCLEDPSCYSPTPGAEGGGQVAGLCLLPLRQTYCSFPVMWSFKVSPLPPMPPPSFESDPLGSPWAPSWKAAVTG